MLRKDISQPQQKRRAARRMPFFACVPRTTGEESRKP
jgi:hypothetical protein